MNHNFLFNKAIPEKGMCINAFVMAAVKAYITLNPRNEHGGTTSAMLSVSMSESSPAVPAYIPVSRVSTVYANGAALRR